MLSFVRPFRNFTKGIVTSFFDFNSWNFRKSKKHFICLFSVFSPEAAEESVPSKGEKEEPMDVQESETPATNE